MEHQKSSLNWNYFRHLEYVAYSITLSSKDKRTEDTKMCPIDFDEVMEDKPFEEVELNRLKEELERNNKVELARQLREQVTDIRAYREWQRAKSIDELAIAEPVSQSKLPRRRSNMNDREIPM